MSIERIGQAPAPDSAPAPAPAPATDTRLHRCAAALKLETHFVLPYTPAMLRFFPLIAVLFIATSAVAADKRALVVETKKSGFKDLARGLRVTLKQNHNYETVKESEFQKESKKRGISAGAKPADVAALAKQLGADLVVFTYATKGGGGWSISVQVQATDARGTLLSKTYKADKPKLDRTMATEIAREVRQADASGVAAAATTNELDFSLGDQTEPAPSAATGGTDSGMSFDTGDAPGEVALKVAPKALKTGEAADANENDAAALAAEYENDDEFYEPTDELSDKEEEPRYVAPDGRSGLVATAGFSMLLRDTGTSALNGTPPRYSGIMSPGVAFLVQLFPRRFKESGGIARDFGGYVRGNFSFMPSEFLAPGTSQALNYTDQMFHVDAGAKFRHVFGNQEKSLAFGAEIGIQWDQVNMTAGQPFPTTMYLSPFVAAELEAPLYRKLAVLTVRAGVLPISGVHRQQIETFGLRKFAFGVTGSIGVHSTIWNDILYLEALGYVTNYWQEYSGAGTSRFTDVAVRDTTGGFTVSAGIAL